MANPEASETKSFVCVCVTAAFLLPFGLAISIVGLILGFVTAPDGTGPAGMICLAVGLVSTLIGIGLIIWLCKNQPKAELQQGPIVSGAYAPPGPVSGYHVQGGGYTQIGTAPPPQAFPQPTGVYPQHGAYSHDQHSRNDPTAPPPSYDMVVK